MSAPFDPTAGAIVVLAHLTGLLGTVELHLALDTGSTCSSVSESMLRSVGYDPSQATSVAHAIFGSGTQMLPLLDVQQLSALGQDRTDYTIVCHTLPPGAGVDGVLGLDFFTGHVLTIDFINNTLDLT